MSDPAFAGAGKKPGMELWRIEKLNPVRQASVGDIDYYWHFELFNITFIVLRLLDQW